MVTFINVNPDIVEKLKHFGFKKIATKSPHELARLEGPCFAILFHSKKLLLQGKREIIDEISKMIESLGYQKDIKIILTPEEQMKKPKNIQVEIGSDETLKGDTFGGLVVAATLIDENTKNKLKNIRITDSKKLNDEQIKQTAKNLKNLLGQNQISVRVLTPKNYNDLIKQGLNVTQIMNRLHDYVHKELENKNPNFKKITHITDKYPGCNVGDIIEEKADSNYLSVAAASIIARNAGLIQLETIGDELNIPIPKGSTHIKNALEILKKSNLEIEKYIKTDFKNVKEFFN